MPLIVLGSRLASELACTVASAAKRQVAKIQARFIMMTKTQMMEKI